MSGVAKPGSLMAIMVNSSYYTFESLKKIIKIYKNENLLKFPFYLGC